MQGKMTYIGGPTALLEVAGLRFLTDPTFDPPGEYHPGPYTLKKLTGPAVLPDSFRHVDAVLLSHDHHLDNLDNAGRAFLPRAGSVLTTPAGAERLGGNAVGLARGTSIELAGRDGRAVRVTATPAQHGPAHMDRGPVTGFVLSFADRQDSAIYISGDTVWHEDLLELRQFSITTAILFMGAARVPEVGPWHLTFTAEEGVQFAQAFPDASIVPLHFEGWRHFSESGSDIAQAFSRAGLEHRLRWPDPGREILIGDVEEDRLRRVG